MKDDTLILYYYDDGLSDDERAAIAAALEKDSSLRERYRALQRALDRFNEPPVTPAPEQAVARWHRAIEQAAARESARRKPGGASWHLPSFAWGALVAAVLAAVAIGLYFRGTPLPTTAEQTIAENADRPGIDAPVREVTPVSFARGLKVHLRESREDILRLAPAHSDMDRTMLIMDILRQNRLFEQAAQEHDAEDVARLLRAFEQVLVRLADDDISTQEAAALRGKLVFELNVMLTKMEQRESDDSDSI